jgi:integrase/recombinase XerD
MEPHETLSFIAALKVYEKHCLADGLSISTVLNKRCNLELFFKWALANGVDRPSDVTRRVGEDYKAYLVEYVSPHTGKTLKKSTRRKRVSDVRVFFAELAYLDVFEVSPLQQLRLPKSPRPMVTALLSEREVERVMLETKQMGLRGLRDRAILECYYATAGRRNEIGNLQLCDIKFEREQVLIKNGKGDKTRYVPLAPRTACWLKAYYEHVRPKVMNLKSGTVFFLDNQGLAFRPHQLTALVKKYLLKAGIDVGAACNAFRHSAATHMLEHGADIREIQEYLGHADLSTTQVYVHVTQNQLKKTYAKPHPAALQDNNIKVSEVNAYLINS